MACDRSFAKIVTSNDRSGAVSGLRASLVLLHAPSTAMAGDNMVLDPFYILSLEDIVIIYQPLDLLLFMSVGKFIHSSSIAKSFQFEWCCAHR